MRVRRAPPISRCSGTPAALPAMSQSAMSSPERAKAVIPKRPKMWSCCWIFACSPPMSVASCPVASGAIMSRTAATTAARQV